MIAAFVAAVELGAYLATGSIYNPTPIQFGTPSSYTITTKYVNPAPKLEGGHVYVYVIVGNRVVGFETRHLGFTPPEISDTKPGPVKNDWLQADSVVLTHGPLTIALHGHYVSILRGTVVVSAKPLHQTTKGGGPLLED